MRRAMGIGFMIGFGNIGGLIGSYIYLDKESPRYPTGYGTSLAFGVLGVFCSLGLEFTYSTPNKKKAELLEAQVREMYTPDQLAKMEDKESPFQIYSVG